MRQLTTFIEKLGRAAGRLQGEDALQEASAVGQAARIVALASLTVSAFETLGNAKGIAENLQAQALCERRMQDLATVLEAAS